MDGHRPVLCPLGVNGGEFPHWSVGQICDPAVKIGAKADGSPVGQHHNPTFEIDEGALPIGLEVLMAAARRVLAAA